MDTMTPAPPTRPRDSAVRSRRVPFLVAALVAGAVISQIVEVWPDGDDGLDVAAAPGPAQASSEAGTSAKPFRVPRYPTPQDADQAFVSEVLPLGSLATFLNVHGSNIPQAADLLATSGRGVCTRYDGDNAEDVSRMLRAELSVDDIDAAAFTVSAAAAYCPEKLADLGQGQAMTDGFTYVDVEPRCPTEPPVTIEVSALRPVYDGDPTEVTYGYTVRNDSPYGVLLQLEELQEAPGYQGDWTPASPPGDELSYGTFFLPAHGRVAGEGDIGGIYEWSAVRYRVSSWLPVGCHVRMSQD